MIVRLVRMTFLPAEIANFQRMFEDWRHRIIAFPGCQRLDLLHSESDPCVFFTHSEWADASDLQAYRDSELFNQVWPKVKLLFAVPALAWSLQREHTMLSSSPSDPRS